MRGSEGCEKQGCQRPGVMQDGLKEERVVLQSQRDGAGPKRPGHVSLCQACGFCLALASPADVSQGWLPPGSLSFDSGSLAGSTKGTCSFAN